MILIKMFFDSPSWAALFTVLLSFLESKTSYRVVPLIPWKPTGLEYILVGNNNNLKL